MQTWRGAGDRKAHWYLGEVLRHYSITHILWQRWGQQAATGKWGALRCGALVPWVSAVDAVARGACDSVNGGRKPTTRKA